MAGRFEEFDWSQTSIGPVECWPRTWRNVVDLILVSSFPSALGLGPELIYIYNDPFIALGGPARHPTALGRPVREVWREIWEPVLERRFSETLSTGHPTGEADLLMPLVRSGYLEETYLTFSFAALADDRGNPSGIFCTATENTGLVIAGRQLDCLRRLANHCACAESPADACRLAAQALEGQRRDVPFAIFYLLDSAGARIESIATTGLSGLPAGLPAPASLETVQLIDGVSDIVGPVLANPQVIPQQALAIPFANAGPDAPKCVLLAGLNPMRPVEESRRFFELIAAQVETTLSSASMRANAERRARELAALDRAKTVFFSNVSHELRTPLTLILEPLRQVLDCAQLDAGDRELLLTARRAGARLLKLVNSLLEFSRIEGGRIEAHPLPTDLGLFTADLASMFRSAFDRAGLRFEIECASVPGQAYVDREMWEKIVLNLLSNALKFTLTGQVSIRVRARGDGFELEVADTGAGISAQDLPRIFDRFATIEAPRARTVERTGIGLSLVKELVNLHGGTIEARSSLGAGTTITVHIPQGRAHLPQDRVAGEESPSRAESAALPYLEEALGWLAADPDPTPAAPAEAPTRGERILVVDDNADMRRYLQRALQGHWQVDTAPDGAVALERIRERPPDLIIADIMMPRVDGLELLRRVRAEPATEQIPVLLLSARAGEEASVGGLRAGADDYLVKPFSRHELLARIESRLATARQQAAERRARHLAEHTIKAREEFFAALAHELRTPAACLFTWIERLRGQGRRTKDSEALDVLETAAHAIRRLAEDLIDVARGAAGHMRVDRQPYANLAPLIEGVVEAYGPAALQKGITLEARLDKNCGPVEVDADRIQQIVSNLLSNAIRFTPTDGRIEVRCRPEADGIELLVRDSGRGIPADALPRVFERYWQGTPALNADGGLGLGLAICRQLVELHDGRIEALSEGQDKGATFIVRLPRAKSAGKKTTRRKAPLHARIQDAAFTATHLAGRQTTPPRL
jgi:signal transduction histidine kinase